MRWLRAMARERESKMAQGGASAWGPMGPPPPPYAFIPAPVSSAQLLSPDHPHRIALRCRFVINLVRRRKPVPSAATTAPDNASATPSKTDSEAGPHSTQLGRPTKSNINAQRVIADLSVATALDEDERKERFRTEVCCLLIYICHCL